MSPGYYLYLNKAKQNCIVWVRYYQIIISHTIVKGDNMYFMNHIAVLDNKLNLKHNDNRMQRKQRQFVRV